MIIKRKQLDAEWFTYKEKVKLFIRPFPQFTFIDREKESVKMWNAFSFACQGWEGLKEEDGKDFEFTPENKRFVFDFVPELVQFVFEKANQKTEKIVEQIKNL